MGYAQRGGVSVLNRWEAENCINIRSLLTSSELNRPQIHEAMARILNVERTQLQVLFNQAPGFIAVLTGKNHVFEIVNEAYYQLVGHRDIIGKPAMDALPELEGQGFKELLDSAYDSGKPIVLRDRKVSIRRTLDAPIEERYVDLLYQPIVGIDGRITGVIAQGNDVTGAHLANLRLAEKVAQLEGIREKQAFQIALGNGIRAFSKPDEITAAACKVLGKR